MATDSLIEPDSDAASAPAGVPVKPEPKDFLRPVPWLFGRQFIASLKGMLLYAAFKGKLDPRDWMKAGVIPDDAETGDVDAYWRQWNEERATGADAGEFWFDYISDTGDGQRAVYSIAYLCMSDLAAGREPSIGDTLEPVAQPEASGSERVLLPRGAFLFVGGDTSYHISDYGTLANRFQNPFCWAYRDLYKRKAASVIGDLPRLLFGIPGNHDYYDSIDGFNRQFRRPSTDDEDSRSGRKAQLTIPTFGREQEASYVALRLPHGWWFWGLDTEEGEIDFRQWEFFDSLRAKYEPRKLIIATPEPTTVFGKYTSAEANQSKTFAALGLERPFLKDGAQLPPGKCRLDLSGDIHHYARHWGTPAGSQETSNYASVVAGAGGAFFHPTQTTAGEVAPEVIYPVPDASRRKVADELFTLTNIVKGGYVWLFGFIIAFVLAFAANFPQSSRDSIDGFPPFIDAGVSPPVSEQKRARADEMPRYTWGPNARMTPEGFYRPPISLAVALVLLGAALIYSSKLFKQEYDPTWSKPRKEVRRGQRLTLWSIVAVSFIALMLGIYGFRAHELALTRFGRSAIILVALLWAVLALVQSVKYSAWLFEEAHTKNVMPWFYWPIWGLIILSVLSVGSALWFFGRHESAFLISDVLLLVVAALVVGGLIVFAVSTGGGLKKGAGKFAFFLLGLSHGLLQLSIPFILFRRGHLLWATLATLALVFVSMFVGRALARLSNGWPLALAWVAFGAALVAIPFLLDASSFGPSVFDTGLLNRPDGGWEKLALTFYAGVMGAIMSCALFGWYLGVALAFNGHNNEAGGAARIEGFKQFIRIRINRDGLTGYVIAFDKPETDGDKLKPRIVDIFKVGC